MWKKPDPIEANAPPEPPKTTTATSPARLARIGGSLSIKGDLYGEEDLFIEGAIEGKITVHKGSVTVGEKGRVKADIEATNIHVAGEVKGDLAGSDQVVLLETGRVEGNIKAKSVTLQNGARFKGSIDMESVEGVTPRTTGVVARKANGSRHVPTTPSV